jgi:tRNA (cytidine/uridine-2'-O-)-methyltransferase
MWRHSAIMSTTRRSVDSARFPASFPLRCAIAAICRKTVEFAIGSAQMAPLTLALYQPDIPQNAGTMLRMCACLGVEAAIIGPAGFPITDAAFRRAGMDYLDLVTIRRHASFDAFQAWRAAQAAEGRRRRLILLSTHATLPYTACKYESGDILMVGRESAGAPDDVFAAADLMVKIPMRPPARSLNVAISAAMVVGEALRRIDGD